MLRTFHAGLALLLLLSLAACRQEGKQVQGLVTQVQYTERGELTNPGLLRKRYKYSHYNPSSLEWN